MHEEYYELINLIIDNSDLSQRKIAEALNISTGKTNSLIKKAIEENIIIESVLDSRSRRYYISEAGYRYKTKIDYNTLKDSFFLLEEVRLKLKIILKKMKILNSDIYIQPLNNYFDKSFIKILNEFNINYLEYSDSLNLSYSLPYTYKVILWDNGFESYCIKKNISYINILKEL